MIELDSSVQSPFNSDGDEFAPSSPLMGPAPTRSRLQRIASIVGPGLLVMLADTDASCLITAAQTGVQFGYSLIWLQLCLIPVVYAAQELTIRLGLATGKGHGELIKAHFGPKWAWLSVTTLWIACTGALVSEMSGCIGVAQLLTGNMPGVEYATVAACVIFLLCLVLTGAYTIVERIAILLGCMQFAYILTMFVARPHISDLGHAFSNQIVDHLTAGCEGLAPPSHKVSAPPPSPHHGSSPPPRPQGRSGVVATAPVASPHPAPSPPRGSVGHHGDAVAKLKTHAERTGRGSAAKGGDSPKRSAIPPPISKAGNATKTALVPSTTLDYLGLIAGNIGAVIMPFMLFFQQSAVVDKGLTVADLHVERIETVCGSFITQIVMIAVIITMGAPFYYGPHHGTPLPPGLPADPGDWTIENFAAALYPHFGKTVGNIVFSVGMVGGAAVGAIVVSLTAAWGVGEVTGWARSLSAPKWEARWFYACYGATIFLAAVIVLLPGMNGSGLVKLNIAIQQLNALLLPIVLGFLYLLARDAIPDPALRLKGRYATVLAMVFSGVCLVAVFFALWSLVNLVWSAC